MRTREEAMENMVDQYIDVLEEILKGLVLMKDNHDLESGTHHEIENMLANIYAFQGFDEKDAKIWEKRLLKRKKVKVFDLTYKLN